MKCEHCGREFTRRHNAQRYCNDPACVRDRETEQHRKDNRKLAERRWRERNMEYLGTIRIGQWRGPGPGKCAECIRHDEAYQDAVINGGDVLGAMRERYQHQEQAHGIPYMREIERPKVEQLTLEGVRG